MFVWSSHIPSFGKPTLFFLRSETIPADEAPKLANPNINITYEKTITIASVEPGSIPRAQNDTLAGRVSPRSQRRNQKIGQENSTSDGNKGNSSANPLSFSQLTKSLDSDKGVDFLSTHEKGHNGITSMSRRDSVDSNVSGVSSAGSYYNPSLHMAKTLYVPMPRSACNNAGQYTDLDYSALKFEDLF